MDKLFCILIILSPLFQGLYFYHEAYFTGAILALCLIILLRQRSIRLDYSLTHGLIIVYGLLYVLSISYAVDKGMALMGVLKIVVCYLFYLLLMQLLVENQKYIYYKCIAYSACLLSAVGVLGFFIPDLGEMTIQNGRLGSLIQYPNTFGLYQLVGLILLYDVKPFKKGHFFGSTLLWVGLFLTYSRSLYIIAIIGCVILVFRERDKIKRVVASLGMGILISCGLMVYFDSISLLSRIQETSFSVSEWQTRLLYYKDSLAILKDFPFGSGSLGYYYVQRMYQTGSMYLVKYTHSYLIQVLMDIGVLGAVVVTILGVIVLVNQRLKFIEKLLLCLIIAHGCIDFDLQFPIIAFVILLIIGIRKDKIKQYKLGKMSLMLLFGIMCVYILMGISSYYHYTGHYHAALNIYPWNTEAKLKVLSTFNEHEYMEKEQWAESIVQLNPYTVDAYCVLRDHAYQKKNYKKAIEYSEQLIKINPLEMEHLEIYSDHLVGAIKHAFMVNDLKEGSIFLDKCLKIPYYIDKLRKERATQLNVHHRPNFTVTDKIKQNMMKAEKMMDEYFISMPIQ